jgi:hypothetical protein
MANSSPHYHDSFNGYNTGIRGIVILLRNGNAVIDVSPEDWNPVNANERTLYALALAAQVGLSVNTPLGAIPQLNHDASDLKNHPVLSGMMSFLKNHKKAINAKYPRP